MVDPTQALGIYPPSALMPKSPTALEAALAFPPDPIPSILLGGSINLLAGASGVGKTAFLSRFLWDLVQGRPVFKRQPNPIPKVVILSIDRSWQQSSSAWYRLAGWQDDQLAHYCLQDDLTLDLNRLRIRAQRISLFRYMLDQVAPLPFGSLVVTDPIAPFLGGNLMDYDACMVACTQLRRVCRERGITIIGTAHASKQKNDSKPGRIIKTSISYLPRKKAGH